MIASLPMYDRPQTAAANDRLWQHVRRNLPDDIRSVPDSLTRPDDPWTHWLSPDLLLSQTCGLPYRTRLHGKVTLVGTPVHDLPDTPPGHYYSAFVARRDDSRRELADFADAVLAVNETGSQSGWAAPQSHANDLGFGFSRIRTTGAHRASAQSVAEGRADIAALDAVTWRMIRRWDGFATSLAEIGRTRPTPALPFISARGNDAAVLRDAIAQAIGKLSQADCDTLSLTGITFLEPDDYLSVPTPPAP